MFLKTGEAQRVGRIPGLDGTRAIAALMVMAFHFSQTWWPNRLMIFGQSGVDLFFVLSGFLITGILLKSTHGDWQEIRKFYIRRVLRIFPLYYAYLVIAALLGATFSGWYWFYVQNIIPSSDFINHGPVHFWSLAVEEQFYFVWPFLILFWPRRWLLQAIYAVAVCTVVTRIFLVREHVEVFYLTITRLDGLSLGALLAFYSHRDALARHVWILKILAVVAILTLALEWSMSRNGVSAIVQVIKYTSYAALYASLIGLLIVSRDTILHSILDWAPLRSIGAVSYGMYVLHPMVFAYLPHYLGNIPLFLKAGICFSVVYALAVASFYGFEMRFIRLKDRLAPNRGPSQEVILAKS